jgi:hypothetical protein
MNDIEIRNARAMDYIARKLEEKYRRERRKLTKIAVVLTVIACLSALSIGRS